MFFCRDCGMKLVEGTRVLKETSPKTGKRYYLNRCRPCLTESNRLLRKLKKKHPRPPAGTPCACCGRRDKLLCDHDHGSWGFRGWICSRCNSGLGQLGDSIESLQQALRYLERAQARSNAEQGDVAEEETDHGASSSGDVASR